MKCYILGSTGGELNNSEEIYSTYKDALKDRVSILGTPLETAKFNGTAVERFARAEKAVRESDVIIAEMSAASTGAGIEIGMAYLLGKQIYCFAKCGSKVSGLVVGMIGEENVYYYKTPKELELKLKFLNLKQKISNG